MRFLTWVQDTSLAQHIAASPTIWGYPTILTAHTVGLAILVGANIVLDLRILGFFQGTPLAPFKTLVPIMWLGFWVNAASGVCLFIADATTKGTQIVFYVKLLFIAAGIVVMVLLRRRVLDNPLTPALGPVPHPGRTLAGASLVCWAGAMTAGRLMAYLL